MPTWSQLHPGDDPAVDELRNAVLHDHTAGQKLGQVGALVRATRRLALGGLRRRHPLATEAALLRMLGELLYGPAAADRCLEADNGAGMRGHR